MAAGAATVCELCGPVWFQISRTWLITDTTDWIKQHDYGMLCIRYRWSTIHRTGQGFDQATIAYQTCNLISYGYRLGKADNFHETLLGSLIDNSPEEWCPLLSFHREEPRCRSCLLPRAIVLFSWPNSPLKFLRSVHRFLRNFHEFRNATLHLLC